MNQISDLIYPSNFRYTSLPAENNAPIVRDAIYGSSGISLENDVSGYYEKIYIGSGNSCINDKDTGSNSYRIIIDFSFAEKSSDSIPFTIQPFVGI